MERERLKSRLGFILISAGCAIGVGNVWKFPWMVGQNGGGAFVFVYLIFLVLLGLPIMVTEFSLGRASRRSPVGMLRVLEKPGQKWHWHGYVALGANVMLTMFYTSVTGWIFYYFLRFLSGNMTGLPAGEAEGQFQTMLSSPVVTLGFMALVVAAGYFVISFGLQKGVERVTKVIMISLLVLILVLAVYCLTLSGAGEGIRFYLTPDLSKINGSVVVAAMNQAFFTLSLGIGSMAIFGSYLDRSRSLLGESVNILVLDTFVAIVAGLIIFPACFTFGVEPTAGPSLLFEAMASVFNPMEGGRWWGSLFFLFMLFAAMSTIIAVFENVLACVMELSGWTRKKACIICGVGTLVLSAPCALGFNLWSEFQPFAAGTTVLDLEDFLVSNCALPLGALCYLLFCVSKKGWGFSRLMEEANTGTGFQLKRWMRPYFTYVLPAVIFLVFLIGILEYPFADGFTLYGWICGLFG